MRDSACWQRRKGIRQTVWQLRWFGFAVFTETCTIVQPNLPPQPTPHSIWHFWEIPPDRYNSYLDIQHMPLPQPALSWTRDRSTSGPRLRKWTRTRSWCRSWARRARSRLGFVGFWHLWREGHLSITPKVKNRFKQMREYLCKLELLWTLIKQFLFSNRWNDWLKTLSALLSRGVSMVFILH